MKKLKTFILMAILCMSSIFYTACSCNEEVAPPVDYDYNKNGIIEEWEEEFTATSRPTNRENLKANVVTVSTLTDLRNINENHDTTNSQVYMLTCDIDCNDEVINIKLRNNVLLGNNYVIKNFRVERPNGGDTISLIEGTDTAKIYDLRVYGKIQNIPVDATSTTLSNNNIALFNNIHTLDNVSTKACFNIDRVKATGDTSNFNVNATIMANNCRFINNCTAIGLINYTETAGSAIGTKQFAGIDVTNGKADDKNYSITNCVSKVNMNIYSESTTNIGGITCDNYGTLIGNTVDATSNINYSTFDTIAESDTYKTSAKIAGIAVNTDILNEIRFNVFNGTINASATLLDGNTTPQSHLIASGITTTTNGGIFTFNESRGKINVDNIKDVIVAGFVNTSTNALYHYNICTTDITIENPSSVITSQFSTNLEYGLVEYLLLDTDIYVDSNSVDTTINTALFSLMDTMIEAEEVATPNLYKIIFMGSMSFRIPADNTNLIYKNGLCADGTKYRPIITSDVYYISNECSMTRITPSNTTAEDSTQDILTDATSTFAQDNISSLPMSVLNHNWLFGGNFGMNSHYVGIKDNTYNPDNFYFQNVKNEGFFTESNNLNILNNVRFDFYLNNTYTANSTDELYCILVSRTQKFSDPVLEQDQDIATTTGEIFNIGISDEYLNHSMTTFEVDNKVDALLQTIKNMTETIPGPEGPLRDPLITCSSIEINDIVNGAGDIIGKEIILHDDMDTIIKIDTHMLENNVNYISMIISKKLVRA